MKDPLSSRVGRILSGGINAIIDAIENASPELVMEEAIREIDSAVDDVRTELGVVVANRHLANKRLMEENRKHEELTEKIGVAVNASRDDLAEAAISQQMDIEAQIPVLEKSIADAGDKEKELESYIEALRAKKRELREEMKSFVESRREASSQSTGTENVKADLNSTITAKVEKAQSAFDRIIEKNTGLPGVSDSHDAKSAAQLAELDNLSRQNRIKERLSKIKANKE